MGSGAGITAQGCMYTRNVREIDSNGFSPWVRFVAGPIFGNCIGVEHTLQLLIPRVLMLSNFAAVTYTSCIPAEANEVPVNAVKHMFHHGAVLESIQAAMCALQLSPGTANFLVCLVMHMFYLGRRSAIQCLLILGTASLEELLKLKLHASYVALRGRFQRCSNSLDGVAARRHCNQGDRIEEKKLLHAGHAAQRGNFSIRD